MARTSIPIVLALLAGCAQRELGVESGQNHSNNITVYREFEDAPQEVGDLATRIKALDGDWFRDGFESTLAESGVIDAPYQHLKDFERYWRIDTGSKGKGAFVLAAAFAGPRNQEALRYATINFIENPGGAWRTVWSIKFNPQDPPFDLSPIVRGRKP